MIASFCEMHTFIDSPTKKREKVQWFWRRMFTLDRLDNMP